MMSIAKMFSKEFREHFKNTWIVSYPLVVGQMMGMLMQVVDNIIVGHTGSVNLADISFANNIFGIIFLFFVGLSLAVTPLVGKANGAGDDAMLRAIFRTSFWFHLLLFSFVAVLLAQATPLLRYLGQDERVYEAGASYFKLICYSLVPAMVFCHFKHFLDGLGITKPAAIALVFANVVNVILNYGLVFGRLGLPELGIRGSAIATICARVSQVATMAVYLGLLTDICLKSIGRGIQFELIFLS